MMNSKPVIALLLGDGAGVGPELVAKVLGSGAAQEFCRPVVIGDARVLKQAMQIARVDFPYETVENVKDADWGKGVPVLDQKDLDPAEVKIGQINENCGRASGKMLLKGLELYKSGEIDGFCFAPLNKAALKVAGFNYESEHMLFADFFNWKDPFGEVNVLDDFWTSRVTSHIPIKDLSQNITRERILRAIDLIYKTLKRAKVSDISIGVAALNPHAGENGTCGREEIDVIIPAMEEAKAKGINVLGPYSADILFVKAFAGDFRATVTMYHDQGQIAMKLKGFEQGITISAGFPAAIVTASHGTAFDIAGKGIAKPTAFTNAIKMCARLAACDKEEGGTQK